MTRQQRRAHQAQGPGFCYHSAGTGNEEDASGVLRSQPKKNSQWPNPKKIEQKEQKKIVLDV